MHSRAQAWYGQRTWHWRDWPAEALLERKRRADTRISVVIPARDEERTAAAVVGALRAALMERIPLVDKGVLIDSGSADGTAERPPVAVQLPGRQPVRDGGRR